MIVTGSSGWLGRPVALALLEAGHAVRGIDAVAPPPGSPWDHVSADLTDLGAAVELLREADAVAHIAAIPRPTGRAPGAVFATNVAAAHAVIEAAVLNGVPRVVYASSFSVLGYPFFVTPTAPLFLPLDESHPAAPQDAYALSKWLGEEILDAAVRRAGLVGISLRMPWIQTPASFPREVVPRRADAAGAARDLWSYLDARDAAAAFVAATECRAGGHVRLFLSAADTYATRPTMELARAHFPDVPIRRPIAGTASVFDLAAAERVLGFAPRHSWTEYGV